MIIFVIAAVTDWFDGYFARRYHQISRLGRFLDRSPTNCWSRPPRDARRERSAARRACAGRLIILAREILVSGLREFLAELARRPAGEPAREMEDRAQMTAIAFLLVGEAGPKEIPVVPIGLTLIWSPRCSRW